MARGSLCFVSRSVKSFYLFYMLFSLIKKLDYVNLIKNMLKKKNNCIFFWNNCFDIANVCLIFK